MKIVESSSEDTCVFKNGRMRTSIGLAGVQKQTSSEYFFLVIVLVVSTTSEIEPTGNSQSDIDHL